VRLKLLEIYGNRKDAKAFEAIARELHSSTGAQGSDWEKAVSLGRQIDPSNKLYGGSGEAAPQQAPAPRAPAASVAAVKETAVAPPLDFDLDLDVKTEPAVPDIDLDAPVSAAADQPITIDFDLDLGAAKAPSADKAQALSPDATVALSRAQRQPEAAPAGLDFDLGLGDQPAPPVAQAAVSTKGGLDFDFNLDGFAPAAAAAHEQAPAIDLSAITLDLGGPPAAHAPLDAKWQEVATKLDLAKAYEEMGDRDGARDLLNEVVKEGDTAQQEQAKSLLATLA
jgi:pilus assembly protein FimV